MTDQHIIDRANKKLGARTLTILEAVTLRDYMDTQTARIAELEAALEKLSNFVTDWRDCLDGVQMSTKDFLDDSGIINARRVLNG
jgi:hypothetical protein